MPAGSTIRLNVSPLAPSTRLVSKHNVYSSLTNVPDFIHRSLPEYVFGYCSPVSPLTHHIVLTLLPNYRSALWDCWVVWA